ncbi:MAG: STAS domain-containing protein [Nitrospira sp.]|jgi:anti-anti-sigma factor|nr:STAS domain-containing protein [Nitrospira sp.]
MQITHRTAGSADILDLDGQFNFSARNAFTTALGTLTKRGATHVLFNFRHVTFIDSAAIGLLAIAAQQCKLVKCTLGVVGAQGAVKQVLALARIDQLIPTFPDEAAALGGKAA